MRRGALALFLLAAVPAAAGDRVYRVVSVYDGDTLTTLEHGRVRLATLAAPEIGWRANCKAEHDAGIRARDYLRARTAAGVILRPEPGERDIDPHGRPLRHAFDPQERDIEAEMIGKGLAVRFRHRAPPHDWCRPR